MCVSSLQQRKQQLGMCVSSLQQRKQQLDMCVSSLQQRKRQLDMCVSSLQQRKQQLDMCVSFKIVLSQLLRVDECFVLNKLTMTCLLECIIPMCMFLIVKELKLPKVGLTGILFVVQVFLKIKINVIHFNSKALGMHKSALQVSDINYKCVNNHHCTCAISCVLLSCLMNLYRLS